MSLKLILGAIVTFIGLAILIPVGLQTVSQTDLVVTSFNLTGDAATAYTNTMTGIWGGFRLIAISPTVVAGGTILTILLAAFAYYFYTGRGG